MLMSVGYMKTKDYFPKVSFTQFRHVNNNWRKQLELPPKGVQLFAIKNGSKPMQ